MAKRAVPELLRIEGLRAGYGSAVVLDGVSLEVAEGRSLALLGRNGTGKTTLIDSIVGVTRYHGGSMSMAGRDLTRMRPDERAAAGIGWVPQERNIFKSLTVEENLTAVARPGRWTIEKVYGLFPRLAERRQNKDAVNTSAAIVDAVATGELTPTEAAELCKVVDSYARSLQTVELKERLSKLEIRSADD